MKQDLFHLRHLAWGVLAALLVGCGGHKDPTDIATLDVSRITANWPKFANYQNQLSADMAALDRSKVSARDKQRQRAALETRYAQFQTEVTQDVQRAAEQVAHDRGFKMVVTRQFVGYGGADITADVEKILKIEEHATPKP